VKRPSGRIRSDARADGGARDVGCGACRPSPRCRLARSQGSRSRRLHSFLAPSWDPSVRSLIWRGGGLWPRRRAMRYVAWRGVVAWNAMTTSCRYPGRSGSTATRVCLRRRSSRILASAASDLPSAADLGSLFPAPSAGRLAWRVRNLSRRSRVLVQIAASARATCLHPDPQGVESTFSPRSRRRSPGSLGNLLDRGIYA